MYIWDSGCSSTPHLKPRYRNQATRRLPSFQLALGPLATFDPMRQFGCYKEPHLMSLAPTRPLPFPSPTPSQASGIQRKISKGQGRDVVPEANVSIPVTVRFITIPPGLSCMRKLHKLTTYEGQAALMSLAGDSDVCIRISRSGYQPCTPPGTISGPRGNVVSDSQAISFGTSRLHAATRNLPTAPPRAQDAGSRTAGRCACAIIQQ